MRLDETSAICRGLINNLKPRNVKVNYMYNYGNSSNRINIMYADNIEQGLQVCRLLKEIEPKEVYTVVSSADLSLNLEHVKDYSWKEELVTNN